MTSIRPLHGQKAIVTGASSGIGRAIALALGAAGADVVVNYREGEDAAVEVVRSEGVANLRAARAYEAALEAYAGRDFAGAISLLAQHPDDGPARVLLARCRELVERPPPPQWTGVYIAIAK